MAALALIFSMALELSPHPPHMILLDEVDAHLDQENVNLLQNFIKELKYNPKYLNYGNEGELDNKLHLKMMP